MRTSHRKFMLATLFGAATGAWMAGPSLAIEIQSPAPTPSVHVPTPSVHVPTPSVHVPISSVHAAPVHTLVGVKAQGVSGEHGVPKGVIMLHGIALNSPSRPKAHDDDGDDDDGDFGDDGDFSGGFTNGDGPVIFSGDLNHNNDIQTGYAASGLGDFDSGTDDGTAAAVTLPSNPSPTINHIPSPNLPPAGGAARSTIAK